MPLPPNQYWRGTDIKTLGHSPAGTFAFEGITTTKELGYYTHPFEKNNVRVIGQNVYGKKEQGQQVFCVETMDFHETGRVTRSHTWMTEDQYVAKHSKYWQDFVVKPNRDFNESDGTNKLCHSDGRLKLEEMRRLLN